MGFSEGFRGGEGRKEGGVGTILVAGWIFYVTEYSFFYQ